MAEISVGGAQYLVSASASAGGWTAVATRADTGERFGIECAGETEAAAIHRLNDWLVWQDEHTTALAALQRVQHEYHRRVAAHAFARSAAGAEAGDLQKDALDLVEAARQELDRVRARRPD